MSQFMIKMKTAQRKRDEFEEMISATLSTNKDTRKDMVHTKLELQKTDAHYNSLAKKYEELLLQNKSLQFEVGKARRIGDDHKVRQLVRTRDSLKKKVKDQHGTQQKHN